MSIVLKNVTKCFGKVKAVDNISFVLKPGEVTGLLGPNGAGKTTTVRLITGFLTPSSGSVEVNGTVALRDSIDFRRHIGYLPEDNPLYHDMTVVDYLEFTAGLLGVQQGERRRRVKDVVHMFGLNGVGHLRIGKLSRGYRQRVGLAQTLVHDPQILILDEPTVGLDPNQVMAFRRFISELGKEKTVVFSTHNLSEVQALCDRAIIMSKGRVLSDSSIAMLQQDFQDGMQYFVAIEANGVTQHKDVMLALQNVPCIKEVTQVDQTSVDDPVSSFHLEAERESNVVKELFNLCVSRGWLLADVQRRKVKMEDIFHELTRGEIVVNKTWLMARKELRSYFDSPAAYVFMVLFLVLTGIYVVGNLFLDNIASLRLLFRVAPVVMLVFVPAVTMRLISEEKQAGTFELLGTRPIRTGDIVVGKFLASSFLVICTIVPTVLYAVVLSLLGRLDGGPVVGGYLGLFLLGASFVAIGLFASALSNKQVVSLIVGTILVSCLYFLDRLLPFIPSGLISPVEYLSAGHHFSSLERGVLDSRDIVYDLTLIILFLLLATVAAAREYGQSFRDWRRFLTPAQGLRIVLVAVVLLLANLVSTLLFFRIDLTGDETYTLSSVTKTQLSSLDDNVLVRVYLTADLPPPYHNYRRDIQDLLEEYHVYSGGKVQFKFVNPSDSPTAEIEASEAGISPIYVKVVRNDKIQTAKAYAGLSFSYADRFETLPVVSSVDRLEYDLTSAIDHLRTKEIPVVGLLGGHGCPKPESMRTFLDALGKRYRIESIDLSDSSRSLSELAALLVIGPQSRFVEREKLALDRYIVEGGRVAFFLDAMTLNAQKLVARSLDLGLDEMFDSYGWVINSDLVVDKQCEDIGANRPKQKVVLNDEGPNPFYPVIARFDRSNAAFANLPPVVLPFVSSIDVRLAAARGIKASVVASSSSQSSRLTGDSIDVNLAHILDQVSFVEDQIPLAATFEGSFKSAFGGAEGRRASAPVLAAGGTAKGTHAKIAVVGGGSFVLDGFQQGYHNTILALNLVDWLVDRTGLGIIRTRDVNPPPLDEVSEETRAAIKYFAFIGPPALVILCGLLRMALNASRRRVLKESY